MPLGTAVGLVPGHIVLDGDPKNTAPNFRPMYVVARRLDGSIRHLVGGGSRPGDIVIDGNPAPSKKGAQQPPLSAHVYYGQTAGWIKMPLGTEVGSGPGHIVLYGHPALPKGAQQRTPHFRPMSIVAKRLDGSRCHLVWR